MELRGKEKKPLKQKDVIRLESLYAKHPGDLLAEEIFDMKILTERRNRYGEQV